MYFFKPATRQAKSILPGVSVRTFWGKNVLMSVVDLEANTILPTHSHHHEQCTYILDGELEFSVADETQLVRCGEIIVIPGEVEHFAKVGPQGAKVLDVFNPIREDLIY